MQAITISVPLFAGAFKRMPHGMSLRQKNQGFTLVEISIVLVIIGLILGGILNAQSVIRNAQTKDAIKALDDMSAAARQFNDRYGFWPGDYRNVASLPNLVAPCAVAAGVANGQVDTAVESGCATQHLISAGMLKGTIGTPLTLRASTFSVTGATALLTGLPAASIPANWVNVVRVQVLDCDIAVQMDRATDDGNTNTGNFRTALNICGATGNTQAEATVVANAILRLN
jgi:prepilin-type N-terminal cleavage/methylation domain-containing protein